MSQDVNGFLEHYGIKGMKWGKRKGGLGARVKGASLDGNQRKTAVVTRQLEGRGTREENFVNAPSKILLGNEGYKKALATRIDQLGDQRNRIESGKTTLLDKLELSYDITLLDLTVSRRDNKG